MGMGGANLTDMMFFCGKKMELDRDVGGTTFDYTKMMLTLKWLFFC